MPKGTATAESEYRLPAETPLRARLQSVTTKVIEYDKKDGFGNKTGEKDSFAKWIWEFKIVDGDYAGLKAWGETEDRITTSAANKARGWYEAISGVAIQAGDGWDTDNLVGLDAIITVLHEEPRAKRDGSGMFYGCPVDDVFPADALGEVEPPF